MHSGSTSDRKLRGQALAAQKAKNQLTNMVPPESVPEASDRHKEMLAGPSLGTPGKGGGGKTNMKNRLKPNYGALPERAREVRVVDRALANALGRGKPEECRVVLGHLCKC